MPTGGSVPRLTRYSGWGQTYAALQVPMICSSSRGSEQIQFGGLRVRRLERKLRSETVDLHLGVLVFGVRSDGTFNDLTHGRH
jgi:hypothetical protein